MCGGARECFRVLMELIDEEGSEVEVHGVEVSTPAKPGRIGGEVDERTTEEKLEREEKTEVDDPTHARSAERDKEIEIERVCVRRRRSREGQGRQATSWLRQKQGT
jgi:hypothetical protein